MLVLDATTKSLEFQNFSTAGNPIYINGSWVELDTSMAVVDWGGFQFSLTATGTTTLLAAPGANLKRRIQFINIYNSDTVAHTITIKLDVSASEFPLNAFSLQPGDVLVYQDGLGWKCIDSSGNERQSRGYDFRGMSFQGFQHTNLLSGISSFYVAGENSAGALVTGAPSAGTLRAFPFVAPFKGGTIDQIAFEVTTLLAGNGRIGLYNNRGSSTGNDGDIYPFTLLSDSGSISTGTTGVKTFALSQALTPGQLYWLVYLSDAAATLRCLPLSGMWPIHGVPSTFGAAPQVGISRAFAFAALPSPFGSGGAAITAVPIPALGYRLT